MKAIFNCQYDHEVSIPRQKSASNKQTSVRVGNISDISGKVNVAGGNITTHHTTGLKAEEIRQLFLDIYRDIDGLNTAPATKDDLKAEAAQKNAKVDESFLSHRILNFARMARDVLDLVIEMLANPLAGSQEDPAEGEEIDEEPRAPRR